VLIRVIRGEKTTIHRSMSIIKDRLEKYITTDLTEDTEKTRILNSVLIRVIRGEKLFIHRKNRLIFVF
jgi:hypothetical protein